MNYFKMRTVILVGNKVESVVVECVQQRKLPFLKLIGVPGGAGNAQRERVMAALESSGFRLPPKRITVSLQGAPRDFAPEWADLAVALSILGSTQAFPPENASRLAACGALALDGLLLPLRDRAALRSRMEADLQAGLLLPWDDSHLLGEKREGAGCRNLAEAVSFLRSGRPVGARRAPPALARSLPDEGAWRRLEGDPLAQRVAQIAAAGAHPVLVTGTTAGYSRSLAHALRSILPPPDAGEQEEIRSRHGAAGELLAGTRPFREVSGEQAGRQLRLDAKAGHCGELSLAHGGVLLLADCGPRLPALLRRIQEPLSTGFVRYFHQGRRQELASDWVLLASAGSCPCGGCDNKSVCRCPVGELEAYRKRVQAAQAQLCLHLRKQERGRARHLLPFVETADAVKRARCLQRERQMSWNQRLGLEEALKAKPWAKDAHALWKSSGFSIKGKEAMARVALTLSDLRGGRDVERKDALEARYYTGVWGEGGESGIRFASSADPDTNSTATP